MKKILFAIATALFGKYMARRKVRRKNARKSPRRTNRN